MRVREPSEESKFFLYFLSNFYLSDHHTGWLSWRELLPLASFQLSASYLPQLYCLMTLLLLYNKNDSIAIFLKHLNSILWCANVNVNCIIHKSSLSLSAFLSVCLSFLLSVCVCFSSIGCMERVLIFIRAFDIFLVDVCCFFINCSF